MQLLEIMCVIYQYINCLSVVIIILCAALLRDYNMAAIIATIVMVIANFISQIVIAGGGLSACIDFIVIPFLGILVAWITVWLALLILGKRGKK